MKELLRQTLTGLPETPYYRGGDIFMAGEPGGENMSQNPNTFQPTGESGNVDMATRRLEAAARKLLENENLNVDVRRGAEEIVGESSSSGSQEQVPEIKTGRATWKSKDADQPINVTGYFGRGLDEREYVSVEGSSTGVPLDEIEFPTPATEAGAAGGGEGTPPPPPVSSETPPEEPEDQETGEASREEAQQDQARRILEDLVQGQVSFANVGAGITDESLTSQINEIKAIFSANPLDKVDELRKAVERIRQLERVPEGEESPDLKTEKDRIFLAEKNRVMERLGNVAEIARRATAIIEGREREESPEGIFGERKLSYGEKERIRNAKTDSDIEDLFNRVFDRVDRRPNADFNTAFGNVGAYEYDEFMRVLNDAINRQNRAGNATRVGELEAIVVRLSNERAAREIIHNSYFAVITAQNTEAVSNYMASFLTGYADLAFGKAGVVQAMHFYEQALLMVREKNGGYLPAKEVVGNLSTNERGEVNIITEDLLKEKNESGELAVDSKGNPRQLAKWELDRALSFARGMSVVTGRSIEIAATSILPGTESGSSVYIDLFAQRIIQEIYPFRHADKFITRGKVSRALAYILDRPRKPWTPKELEDFAAMGLEEQVKVLDDLMPEGEERFYSVLNPFEIGSWLSRSGWRIGGDPRNPGETAIKKMMMDPNPDPDLNDRKWIGTGVTIEKERGNLEKLTSKVPARRQEGVISLGKIEDALRQTARVTPLRFFLNIRELKERVITDLLERHSDYFSVDEKKAISAEIDRRFEGKEATRKAEDEKDAELLKRKGIKPEEKDEGKEKVRIQEQRDKITSEVVMKSPKFSKDMRDLVLLQERAVANKDEALVRENSPLGEILQNTFLNSQANVLKRKDETYLQETFLQMFLRRLEHKSWKTPFVFGTEDVPFQKYVFEETGARSGSRRWADMAAAAKAGQAFGELLNGLEAFTEQGQIVEAMYKIHHFIKDYNEESAQRFILSLSEGIMKFYAKTWTHRLPLGIGTANSMTSGKSSYAQIAFGRDKMAWDETKLNEFTRLVRNRGMNTLEQQHKLQERAGGDKKGVVWDSARTMIPLIMIALAYYMMSQAAKKES